jgi:hypothetical protein
MDWITGMTNVPAVPSAGGVIGLEDISANELSIPRLAIDHKKAVFRDSLSNEEFAEFDTVVLGVCKQRVLWPTELRDGAKPLCKSQNGTQGLPADNFPWKESGFTPTGDEDQLLDCAACQLKEWGSHPTRAKIAWCTDQRVVVCLREGAPYLLSLQRSGIKPINGFMTHFVQTKTPTFTKHAHVSLKALKSGTVDYAVPVFTVGTLTDEADHAEYGRVYLGVRQFVQSRRIAGDDEPMAATKPAPASVKDDEVPW